jgi:hypothetical protein
MTALLLLGFFVSWCATTWLLDGMPLPVLAGAWMTLILVWWVIGSTRGLETWRLVGTTPWWEWLAAAEGFAAICWGFVYYRYGDRR